MSSETKYLNSEYKDFFEKSLLESDPEIFKAINDELVRQQNHIELIASENIVSQAVLEAQGSVLTNKYGPHARAACDYLKISEHLQFIIGADDTEWKKPSPNLTSFALKKLGTSNQETLYVGDSPYDYQTAQNVSMPCILLSTGTHSSDELSKLDRNLIIKRNLSEILPVFNLPNIESLI